MTSAPPAPGVPASAAGGPPPHGVLRLAARAAAMPWATGARLHRLAYQWGLRPRQRLPCAVVAVGSPLVGGTGKTPLVAWLASELRARGRAVAIASRGYGRRSDGIVVVSDGRRLRETTDVAGDEPMWLAARCPGVPVVVAADRASAGRLAHERFGSAVVLLDDGLQHHRLHVDLSLATLDGEIGLGNGLGLPFGPLREPLSMLARADALAVWDRPLPGRDERQVGRFGSSLRRVALHREPTALRPIGGGPAESPSLLRGAEVGVLCGLASPDRLRRTVERLGARVVAERRFRDHHRYRRRDLADLSARARIWVTSEKDATKLGPGWAGDADLRVLASSVSVDGAPAFRDWVEERIDGRAEAEAQRGRSSWRPRSAGAA